MPARGLSYHAGRVLLIAIFALLVGWMLGYPLAALLAATLGVLAWHLFHLIRLQKWLRSPGNDLPHGRGAWTDVFDGLSTIETRYRRRLDRDRAMIGEFTSLTDAFPDATLVIDHAGAITWFNRAAKSLLDLRDPNDLGQQVTNLIRDPAFADWLAVQGEVSSPLDMASPRGDDRRLAHHRGGVVSGCGVLVRAAQAGIPLPVAHGRELTSPTRRRATKVGDVSWER